MSACGSAPVCKANCSIATQWALANTGQIQADADIVGAGVIISFVATAHVTFIVVVIGYLTFSFENDCMNGADNKIVECVRGSCRRLFGLARRFVRALYYWRPRADTDGQTDNIVGLDQPEAEDSPARKYRVEAFRGFMLALSDQQLVTGLAMLVACYGRWGGITIYSANVVSALAYFSASVHMGTLDFLTSYLRGHNIVRGCRVFAMICTATLLVFLMLLQLSSSWGVAVDRSNLFVICAFWDYTMMSGSLDYLNYALGKLYVVIVLVYVHFERIKTLYSVWGRLPQGQDLMTKARLVKYGIKDFEYRKDLYKERARNIIIRPPSLGKTLATWRLVESYAFHETHDSRVWQIASLLYANIYGAILIFELRNEHQGTVGPFNTMGFGQIVPVFLLVLLLFALVESVYGYRDALAEIEEQNDPDQLSESTASLTDVPDAASVTPDPSDNAEGSDNEDADPESESGAEQLEQAEDVQVQELDENPEEADDIEMQELEHIPSASIASFHTSYEEQQASQSDAASTSPSAEDTLVGASSPARHHSGTNSRPSMLRSIARSYSSNVQIRAVSHTSGDDLHQSMPARPRPRHRYRHRSSGSTQKPLDAIKVNDVDDGDASSPDNYHRPIRIDTEASLGLRTSAAERLWNAVQADPKSILARIIMEDLTEVPAIYRIMVLYAVCIIVLQSLLACATHRIFGFAAFLIIAAVIASTEVRHMLDLFNRLGRVRRLGAILAEQRRRALLAEQRRSSVTSNGTK